MTKAAPQTTPMMQRIPQATACTGETGTRTRLVAFAQPLTVRQSHFFFLAEHESRLHILHVHVGVGAHEYAAMRIGERHLRKMIAVGENAKRKATASGGGQLRPSKHQPFRHVLQFREGASLDYRTQRHCMASQFVDNAAFTLTGLLQGIAERIRIVLLRLGQSQIGRERVHRILQPAQQWRAVVLPMVRCTFWHDSHCLLFARHQARIKPIE